MTLIEKTILGDDEPAGVICGGSNARQRKLTRRLFRAVSREWGNAWKMLGDHLKRAVLGQRVTLYYAGLGDVTVSTAEIQATYASLLDYCGLDAE